MPRSTETFMTVAPDGTITFDFTGVIHATGGDFTGHVMAQGLDILAGDTSSPPDDRKITWHKTTYAGAIVADLSAFEIAGFSELDMRCLPGVAGDAQTINLFALRTLVNAGARLQVTQQPGLGSALSAVSATADATKSRTIVDGTDSSSFLGFPSNIPRTHKINYGSFAFNWNGANQMTFVVNHGLSVQPLVAFACQANNNTLDIVRVFPGAPGGVTQFTIDILANVNFGGGGGGVPAVGTADNVQWLAIG